MSKFKSAEIRNGKVIIFNDVIDKATAELRIKKGKDVYGSRKQAETLAEALSDGQGSMKHAPHVIDGYKHFHDLNHNYRGHIFYGE